MKKFLILLSSVLAMMPGCMSEKDASDVILLVDPSYVKAAEGDVVRFNIETWTLHDHMASLEISSFDQKTGEAGLESRTLDARKYTGEFLYIVPETGGEISRVEISFEATDNMGNTQSVTAYVDISGDDAAIEEAASSVMMYSPASGKPDGFSLKTLQTLYVSASESADVDIYVREEENPDAPDQMSTSWMSGSGLLFCKMSSGVDYASITPSRLRALYEASTLSKAAVDISQGDVILVGTDTFPLGIILVTGVYDDPGTENDRYIFNIKVLPDANSSI